MTANKAHATAAGTAAVEPVKQARVNKAPRTRRDSYPLWEQQQVAEVPLLLSSRCSNSPAPLALSPPGCFFSQKESVAGDAHGSDGEDWGCLAAFQFHGCPLRTRRAYHEDQKEALHVDSLSSTVTRTQAPACVLSAKEWWVTQSHLSLRVGGHGRHGEHRLRRPRGVHVRQVSTLYTRPALSNSVPTELAVHVMSCLAAYILCTVHASLALPPVRTLVRRCAAPPARRLSASFVTLSQTDSGCGGHLTSAAPSLPPYLPRCPLT